MNISYMLPVFIINFADIKSDQGGFRGGWIELAPHPLPHPASRRPWSDLTQFFIFIGSVG